MQLNKLGGLGIAGVIVFSGALVGACGEDSPIDPGDGGTLDVSVDGKPGVDGAADGTVPVDAAPDAPPVPGDGGPCLAQAPTIPPLRIIPVSSTAASFSTHAAQPKGSTDWYIVEQRGQIRIIRNGAILPTPFLNIQAAMGTNFGERGLLSVAFHPNYAQNGRFFTMATPSDNSDGSYGPANADAVVEWKRDANNPDIATPTKVRDIVVLPVSDTNHNGGMAKFGPDGYLYVGTGDGGGGCESDKPGTSQDPTKLFGKILRLDIDGVAPFAAPGNTITNDARVYHYGLRNPFRFNFDSVTFDLIIGDVGQGSEEELSFAAFGSGGKNFGWPRHEGVLNLPCGNKPLAGPYPHTPPIVSIDRTPSSTSPFKDYKSIIGGAVYRGAALPTLKGVMFFADYYGAAMGAIRYCNGTVYGPVAIPLSSIVTPTSLNTLSSFIEGNDGELYVTYGGGTRIGRIAPQ